MALYAPKWVAPYDRNSHRFTINFDLPKEYSDDVEEYLVDFALGIVEKIEPNSVKLHGDEVAGKKMWEEIKSVSISRESIGKCHFNLRTKDYSEQIHLELDTFLPQGINHIVSKEKLKILFQGDYFYYTVHFHTPESGLKVELPEPQKKFQLQNVEKLCQLIEFLEKIKDSDQELINDTVIGDLHESSSKIEVLENLDQKFVEVFKNLRCALNVSDYFGIKKDLKVSLNEVSDLNKILQIANSLIESSGVFKFEKMWFEKEIPKNISTATPFSITFRLGKYYLYLGAIIIGNPTKDRVEDGKIYYHCRTSHAKILRKNITKKELPKQVKQDLKDQIYSYIENDDNLVLVDLDSNHE